MGGEGLGLNRERAINRGFTAVFSLRGKRSILRRSPSRSCACDFFLSPSVSKYAFSTG